MKQLLLFILIVFSKYVLQAQPVYNASNYASNGDTIYLTSALSGNFNYDTTGASFTWNFTSLTGVSQEILAFRSPTVTGFSKLQWNYIYNAKNVNLSSTDGQTIQVGGLKYSNTNDYFLKNTTVLGQNASSFNIIINNVAVSVKNTYTTTDVLYKFPLNYGNLDSSQASYTTSIPSLYYNNTIIKRVNKVDGWGKVITPYGTFTNCIRLVSNVLQTDTFAIYGTGFPKVTTKYRLLEWLDPSKKFPLLTVKENLVGTSYIPQTVQYYDIRQYYQPNALFAFYSLTPMIGDTVNFQNLSTNGYSYVWDFGDTISGSDNSSTLSNPMHIFTVVGSYQVKLIAKNGSLADTLILPLMVTSTVAPTAAFSFAPATPIAGSSISFKNTSSNSVSYKWNFGDLLNNFNNTSTLQNPFHVFTTPGIYQVSLTAYNGTLSGVSVLALTVTGYPVPVNDSYTLPENTSISGNFLTNDLNPQTGTNTGLTVTGFVGATTHGNITIGGTGAFTYKPLANYSGLDSYTYMVCNSYGCTTGGLNLNINLVAQYPVAVNDSYTLPENTSISGNFLTNDLNPQTGTNTGLTVTGFVGATTHGNITIGGTGAFTYKPLANYSGLDSYTYMVCNSYGCTTGGLNLNINLVAQELDPVAAFSFSPDSILAGDTVCFSNNSINAIAYIWNFGDLTSGINNTGNTKNMAHVFSISGTYFVSLIAINGALSDTLTVPLIVKRKDIATSIGNIYLQSSKLYPNPASNEIQTNILGNGKIQMTVFNTFGQIMQINDFISDGASSQLSLDVANLPNGNYVMHISSEFWISNEKFIICK